MEIIAVAKSVRVSPRKVRLVADAVRKMPLRDALIALSVLKKRGAVSLEKTLKSAAANAKNNNNLSEEALFIKSIDVLEAPSYKRFHASTRGRVHPYKRRGSHIKIVLAEINPETKVQNQEKQEKKEEKKEEK